ncbi:MAG: ammonium transporter [Alphaproteobacteria bacterium]|nr:ammonium transporter [Alphaproteobacteria bacterium]
MSSLRKCLTFTMAAGAAALIGAPDALAQGADKLDPSATAWILTSTALVLFMTLPGLALFYGGLVRAQNVLSVLMQCFAITCIVSVLWLVGVYSLAFGDGGPINAYVGGLGKAFLAGIGTATPSSAASHLPENVFFMFQMTFAIITPALIVGAYVERIKFAAMALFTVFWLIIVYAPVAHWVWGGGWLSAMGVQDFAGGLVVHATCGTAALVIARALGGRRGFPHELQPPHSPGMVMMGAAMLWVGWYGFNGGSALTSDGAAGMAITVTHISAATAALTWMIIEWAGHGKPTLVGITTGAIAGLATITPASGFVGPVGALAIGAIAGGLCYVAVGIVKSRCGIDDSLDVMAVHGVGGCTGTLLTAVFGASALGGLGASKLTVAHQFGIQAIGVASTVVYTAIATWIIVKIVDALVGLRVDPEDELEGLDVRTHGERGYLF